MAKSIREHILEAMTLALLVDSWAETPAGKSVTGRLADAMPAAPAGTYHGAYSRALIYYGRIWQLWKVDPAAQVAQQAKYLGRDEHQYAGKWAHYSVMESLGRKLYWTTNELPIRFAYGSNVEDDLEHPGTEIELEDDLEWDVDWVECKDCGGEMYGVVNELEDGDTVWCEECGVVGEVIEDGDGELQALLGAA